MIPRNPSTVIHFQHISLKHLFQRQISEYSNILCRWMNIPVRVSWEEPRWGEKSWDQLERCTKSWEELRRCEKRREEMRRHETSWHELRRAEKSCEKSWEKERRHEMRWDGMRWKILSGHNVRWDEMGWHRPRWQWNAMSNFKGKLRCDEIRWNEKKSNIQETWRRIGTSRDCRCKAQKARLHPIGTVLVPLYRLWAFQFWNFRPGLARALLVWFAVCCALV